MKIHDGDDNSLEVPRILFLCCLVGVLVFLFLSTHLSPDTVKKAEAGVQSVFSKEVSTEVYFYGYTPHIEK